ncbi:uncharacterized protein LOC119662074 [Teleopsis dalmanni]|uniref:uncharacterized protein LOC119662074 n=1 Tax=Teleopsis dalmanni TaxID=139649 RepID=UPI0018CE7BDF|nr:uncharacterized protein LOC119662074 [Teleopsis dalmanni]
MGSVVRYYTNRIYQHIISIAIAAWLYVSISVLRKVELRVQETHSNFCFDYDKLQFFIAIITGLVYPSSFWFYSGLMYWQFVHCIYISHEINTCVSVFQWKSAYAMVCAITTHVICKQIHPYLQEWYHSKTAALPQLCATQRNNTEMKKFPKNAELTSKQSKSSKKGSKGRRRR